MSTRATYQIECQQAPNGFVTYYIHHDGYAEGAAEYFFNAVMFSNQRGGLANSFLRANDGAEITRDHRAHGDTEYRWTYADGILTGTERRWDCDGWVQVFQGSLVDFINAYPEMHGSRVFVRNGCYLTGHIAREELLDETASMQNNIVNGWASNASSSAKEVFDLDKCITEFDGGCEETRAAMDRVLKLTPFFVDAFNWSGEDNAAKWNATFYGV